MRGIKNIIISVALLTGGYGPLVHSDDAIEVVKPVNERRAIQNFTLNCQGCHQRSGEGSKGGAPSMVGTVANFLNAPGGREFLLRVPGVASTALKSEAVAELMNWLIYEFDAEHVPADFVPFTGDEVHRMRQNPYVQEAGDIRAELMAYLKSEY